jgi:nitrite reductase/ring-hydroxylating ferredoxin subunit
MSELTRREFLKVVRAVAAVLGLTAVGGPVAAYFYPADLREQPAEAVLVGPESELPVGSSKTVPFGRYPALVINTPSGLRAYSAVCTHFACLVTYDASVQKITCPCHAGFFDPEDGSVLSGPPPRPLAGLRVQNVNGQIYIEGVA